MKRILLLLTLSLPFVFLSSCNWFSSPPPTFCDTSCSSDTISFTGTHQSKPTVKISIANCLPDTLIWSYEGLGINRKIGFAYLIGASIKINKDFVRAKFNENKYAWILFNDCLTGRGFQIKLPYDKETPFSLKSSGINPMDPKFSIAEGLIVNTDRGNIFVEDAIEGKKAMMTFGQKLDIDYDALHDHIDSVNVTRDRIWVRIKIGNDWVEKEKKIILE